MPQSVMKPFVRKSPLALVDCVVGVLVPLGPALGVPGVPGVPAVPGVGMEEPRFP